MKKFLVNTSKDSVDKLIYSGLIGVAVVAVIQFLQLPSLDTPLKISVYCFAIAIPLLSICIEILTMKVTYKYTILPMYFRITRILGVLIAFVGVGAIFWHFSWISGVVFIVFSIVASIISIKFENALESVNKDAA